MGTATGRLISPRVGFNSIFVWCPARAPHGGALYVWRACRNPLRSITARKMLLLLFVGRDTASEGEGEGTVASRSVQ